LGASRKPVIVCGTVVSRETTPGFAADCARLLGLTGKDARLFYLLPGASAFSSALLSGTDVSTFEDVIENIENGAVRALVLVESDPFHYYPDRSRLDRAISGLDLVVAVDYFETETVKRATVFYPSSTIFETDSTYVNQEGRAQYARMVYPGGVPIWGGEHPPRIYNEDAPGSCHLPGWRVLSEIAGEPAPQGDAFMDGFSAENAALENLADGGYRSRPMRILPERSGRKSVWTSWSAPPAGVPGSSDGFQLLMVDWMFGTSEFSAHSDSLQGALGAPYMSMSAKDAERMGLSDGEIVIVELDGGGLQIMLSVSDRTAEGVLVIPRHQSIDWRKIKDISFRVLPEKIRKAYPGA
jgi:NADH-quinone oxidoreductase subunit G